ncbi:MAG TPA: hypothetical protein VGA64_11435 [Candidatus Polarisedimenticolia bacterium]
MRRQKQIMNRDREQIARPVLVAVEQLLNIGKTPLAEGAGRRKNEQKMRPAGVGIIEPVGCAIELPVGEPLDMVARLERGDPRLRSAVRFQVMVLADQKCAEDRQKQVEEQAHTVKRRPGRTVHAG